MKKLILLLTITFLCVPGFISAEEGKKLAQKMVALHVTVSSFVF